MNLARLTPLVIATLFCCLLLIERTIPIRRRTTALFARLVLNLAMSALAFIIAGVLVRPLALHALAWSVQKPFGMIHLAQIPPVVEFILAFLFMDLSFYWWHIA